MGTNQRWYVENCLNTFLSTFSTAVAGLVDQLNYVYLTTLSNEECRLAFGNQVNEKMVCVDGNYNEGTCRVRHKIIEIK